jgi:hypothetical protein
MGLTNMSSVDSMFDYSGLIPRYFDVVVQGGGPNSIYLLGMYDIVKKLEKTGDIRVSKYVASDVAAILCVCFCSNVDKQTLLDFCHMMFEDITNDRWKKELMRILPMDAYAMCNHRVHIYTSVPVCSMWFFYCPMMVFSEYRSNRDLVEACSISFRKPSRICCRTGNNKQLRIQLDGLNEGFDRLVFSQKSLFQFYKMTRMTELVLKAEQDAERLFLHPAPETNTTTPHLVQWSHGFSHKKYKHKLVFCFFVPSVAVLFLLCRKR